MAFVRRSLATLLALLASTPAACGPAPGSGQSPAPLALELRIPLKGVSGRIDHLAIDLKRGRLFVAELGAGQVEAVDVKQGRSLRRIGGLKEPQGLAYLPERDELVVASGDGSVRFYHGEDLAPAGRIDLGDDADNVRVDPRNGHVVVGFGSGALAVIDPASRTVLGRLALPAHPESFRLDNGRVFVNLPDARRIQVGDLDTLHVATTWTTPHLLNFPMAIDPAVHTVTVVYRFPARLTVQDAVSGRRMGGLPTFGDSDDLFIDGPRRRLYVSC